MVAHLERSANDPDLIAHEQTYHVFNILVRWSMVVLAALIAGLTLWFATPAGFWSGAGVGVAVFLLGYGFVVRHEEHQPLDVWVEGR
jgi:hypothetical protein